MRLEYTTHTYQDARLPCRATLRDYRSKSHEALFWFSISVLRKLRKSFAGGLCTPCRTPTPTMPMRPCYTSCECSTTSTSRRLFRTRTVSSWPCIGRRVPHGRLMFCPSSTLPRCPEAPVLPEAGGTRSSGFCPGQHGRRPGLHEAISTRSAQ